MTTSAPRYPLLLPSLLILWFSTNSLFALSSHALLLSPSAPSTLFLDLTILQAFLSYLLSHLLCSRSSVDSTPDLTIPLRIPALHLISVSLTNASYALLGATSTLLLKLLEPLPTFVLSHLLLPNPPATYKLFSLVPLLCGILLFTLPNHPLPTLSPILISTVSFPLRNILLSQHSPSPTNSPSASHSLLALLQRFRSLHAPLVFPLLLVGVLKSIFVPHQMVAIVPMLPKMLINALLFAVYQLASLAVLTHLRPLSHSLANSLKRFATIFVAAICTQTVFHTEQTIGLSLAVVGFFGYAFGGHAFGKSKKQTGLVFKMFMGMLGLLSMILVLGVVMQKELPDVKQLVSGTAVVSESSRQSRTGDVVKQMMDTKSVQAESPTGTRFADSVVIHVEPVYDADRKSITLERYADMKLIADQGNLGNFIWQHASYLSLVDLSDQGNGPRTVCWGEWQDCYDSHVAGTDKTLVSYRPGANYFNVLRVRGFSHEIEMMNESVVPMVVGVGIQANYAKNDTKALDIADSREIEVTPQWFELTELAKEMLKMMQQREIEMLVRGDFTLEAIRKEGYEYGSSTGCPTLFLSEEIELGGVLARGYGKLRERIGDRSLKVGMNIKGGTRYLMFLKGMLSKYPNSVIYSQGQGDLFYLEKYGIPFERVRTFTNVNEWREDMKGMDLSIGARIHGNMVAVSVGVPVVVVAPDWRVLELARKMKLAHMSYWEAGALLHEDTDLAELAVGMEWDAREFDENRCRIAKQYRTTLGKVGIRTSKHVDAIAGIC